MNKQVKAALMVAVVALVLVSLELLLKLSTGLAGIFVMGMAGGLLIGNEMVKPAKLAKQ